VHFRTIMEREMRAIIKLPSHRGGRHAVIVQHNRKEETAMLKKLMTTVAAIAVAATTAQAQRPNSAFLAMLSDTGCDSRYSDDKKAFLYQQNYQGREMTVVGEVSSAEKGSVYMKVLPSTLTFDVIVKLRDPKDAFDLEKGQRVGVKFQVSGHGGCFLSYRGDNGVLLQQQAGR
jgi:hypothetical protein